MLTRLKEKIVFCLSLITVVLVFEMLYLCQSVHWTLQTKMFKSLASEPLVEIRIVFIT